MVELKPQARNTATTAAMPDVSFVHGSDTPPLWVVKPTPFMLANRFHIGGISDELAAPL